MGGRQRTPRPSDRPVGLLLMTPVDGTGIHTQALNAREVPADDSTEAASNAGVSTFPKPNLSAKMHGLRNRLKSKLAEVAWQYIPRLMLRRELFEIIETAYLLHLSRKATSDELSVRVNDLRNGVTITQLLRSIETSPEAELRRQAASSIDALSDGEFIARFAELLFHGRGANSEDVEDWKEFLGEDRAKRMIMLQGALSAHLAQTELEREPVVHNPYNPWILGTRRFLGLEEWRERASKLKAAGSKTKRAPCLPARPFHHSGEFSVSAITSLYKGGKFIERFLDNITSQTIFDRSELIIIDANSPDNEVEVIDKYRSMFPNIVYKRINHRIGIYEAWNIGVGMSRGRFLTNTNVDDLRKENSFDLQVSALERCEFADVVYQDFFYSMDSLLTFDEVAQIGVKSDLPIVTPHNLLLFNSPHNAPMWRRELHDEVGLFDATFESAGDWEFWLRCVSRDKAFIKINEPHIVYFQNPEGVSTRPNTKGVQEGMRVSRRHSRKLVSPLLRLSRQEFANLLGGETDWSQGPSYYGAVQRQLDRLGHAFRTHTPDHRSGGA